MNSEIKKIAEHLFPNDSEEVIQELDKYEKEMSKYWKESPVRVQAAILKASGSSKEIFEGRLKLAYQDWRDILVAAGFANDVLSHELWMKKKVMNAENRMDKDTGPKS